MAARTRILIFTAAIGAGHDVPAEILASELRELGPSVEVSVSDGLGAMGPLVEQAVMGGSPFHSRLGGLLFELEYWLLHHFPPTRRLGSWLLHALGARGLLRAIGRERADVVVSTYPGVTEALGRLRRAGRLDVPVIAAITDLAGLRYWAHPGVDLHLVTHPESVAEVRAVAGPSAAVVAVSGLSNVGRDAAEDRRSARAALGLPVDKPVVLVSGGGWGVGDVAGAVECALRVDDAIPVVLAGHNRRLLGALRERFSDSPRVRLLEFTDQMPRLLVAADALIHATAGLTVLEALALGCPVISYGWGRGHIRANDHAYRRHGLAEVAVTRAELELALERALAAPRLPQSHLADLQPAASAVLELLDKGRDDGPAPVVADPAYISPSVATGTVTT